MIRFNSMLKSKCRLKTLNYKYVCMVFLCSTCIFKSGIKTIYEITQRSKWSNLEQLVNFNSSSFPFPQFYALLYLVLKLMLVKM